MNRMNVFLLFAVVIGFSACQSKSKQAAEREIVADGSLPVAPTEEEKTITGVVGDASMNNFMLIAPQRYSLYQYNGSGTERYCWF